MITNFQIFKNTKKEKPEHPDYRLSAKNGNEYTDLGAGWIKEGKNGKYISVQLKSAYNGVGGFYIAQETNQKEKEVKEISKKVVETVEYPTEEISPSDIPF